MTDEQIQKMIKEEFDNLRDFVLEKNKKYGQAVFSPRRIFSKADNIEQIKVRIDDKLSRLINQGYENASDTCADLAGYLILLRVAENIRGIESKTSEVDYQSF